MSRKLLPLLAVGGGLAAAVLAAPMLVPSRQPDVVLVDVVVASKELPPGTRFTKDLLKDQVKRKKFKPDEVPVNAVTDEADLIDRQLTRTLRADDYVGQIDLRSYKPLEPPAGKDLITIRLAAEQNLKPGSRIDIIGTGITRRNQVAGMLVLPNVLVMFVELGLGRPNGSDRKGTTNQSVTISVNAEEARLIRMCESAGIQFSCMLRRERDTEAGYDLLTRYRPDRPFHWWTDNERRDLGAVATVKLPVPTEDLPAGTEITAELIDRKFKDEEFVAPVPENAVTTMNVHLGRFLVEKVAANQFVPKAYFGDRPRAPYPTPAKPRKIKLPVPTEDLPTHTRITAELVEKFKEVEFTVQNPDVAVTNIKDHIGWYIVKKVAANQFVPKSHLADQSRYWELRDRRALVSDPPKRYKYEMQENGEWKLIGEIKDDGTVVPIQREK